MTYRINQDPITILGDVMEKYKMHREVAVMYCVHVLGMNYYDFT